LLLAREYSKTGFSLEQRLRQSNVHEPRRYSSPSVRPKRAHLPRESMLLCGLVVCLIAISVGLISLYGLIVAGSYQLQQMRREVSLLQEEREYLRIEVKRLGSLERIERIAINELGLQYPEKRQWLILSARGN